MNDTKDIVERLRTSTAAMATACSVRMDLWQEHSTAALSTANEIERLRAHNAELREALAVSEKTLSLSRQQHRHAMDAMAERARAALQKDRTP